MAMTRRQARLTTLALVVTGVSLAVSLSLIGFRESITFFYSPSDLIGPEAEYRIPERSFRLGGLVAQDSVVLRQGQLYFTITDRKKDIRAVYEGLPPDLFREGQGIVATGKLEQEGEEPLFKARQLLAKHDETYMPPEVARALDDKNRDQPPKP